MDSLGYAIEEIVGLSELKDDLEEKSEWKRIARITILASVFLVLVAFIGYEVQQMVDSYGNPVWSSYESDESFLPYPGNPSTFNS